MKKLIVLILFAFMGACERIPYEPRDTTPIPVMKEPTKEPIDMNIKWC